MAAPNSAYAQESLFIINLSGVQIEHLLALLQVDNNTHKARFYLDAVVLLVLPDGSQGIAGVIYPGTNNFAMHNIARQGIGRSEGLGLPSGGVILNDAGLNTLSAVFFLSWGTTFPNKLMATLNFVYAWYNNSTIGFQYRKTSSPTWVDGVLTPPDSSPIQQSVTKPYRLVHNSIEPNTQYFVRFKVINEEGTYYTGEEVLYTDDMLHFENFWSRSTPCGSDIQIHILYMREMDRARMETLPEIPFQTVLPPVFAYTDEDLTTHIAPGWYFSNGWSYLFESSLGFVQRQYCEPPIVYLVSLNIMVEEGPIFTIGNIAADLTNISGSAFSSPVTITATVTGSLGGVTLQAIPISVTLPSGQMSAQSNTTFLIEQDEPLQWAASGAQSSREDIVMNNQIQINITS